MLNEVDNDADKWEVVIWGVRVKIFPNIMSKYLGIQRRVEPSVGLLPKKIFRLMKAEYHYLI